MSVNELSVPQAQENFIELIRNVGNPEKVQQFLKWIQWNWLKDEKAGLFELQDEILKNIASDIRNVIPFEAILPSENICIPSYGENSNLDPRHTAHVDGFLYDDDHIDELCEEGKMSRNYCLDCGSHKTKPITFISHSASRERLLYIFTALLGPLNDKTILDVGSRLGAVLYGAYLFSKAAKIIGIELNKDLCELQKGVVQKYGFQDRVEVVEGNLLDAGAIVHLADVIVLNNVFEFFMSRDCQVQMWRFLRENVKSGTLLVTIPRLDATLENFKEDTGIILETWVKEIPPFNADAPGIENVESEMEDVKLVDKGIGLLEKSLPYHLYRIQPQIK